MKKVEPLIALELPAEPHSAKVARDAPLRPSAGALIWRPDWIGAYDSAKTSSDWKS